MTDIIVTALLVAVVTAVIIVLRLVTKRQIVNHKIGTLVIPVRSENDGFEEIASAVKSVYYEENFFDFSSGREILIVDFGCNSNDWNAFLQLAEKYKNIHALKSFELYAYFKAKSG